MDNSTYANLVSAIVNSGTEFQSRSGKTFEILGSQMLLAPNTFPARQKFSPRLAWADAFQAAGGYFDPQELEDALGFKMRIPYNRASAWGPYLKAEILGEVIYQLHSNPETRRAVIHFGSDQVGEVEKPCCVSMQFIIRDSQLFMVVTMRSWDFGVGFLYDYVVFQTLQLLISHFLKVTPGLIIATAGSCHIYEKDVTEGRFGEPSFDVMPIAGVDKLVMAFPDLAELELKTFELTPELKIVINDLVSHWTTPTATREEVIFATQFAQLGIRGSMRDFVLSGDKYPGDLITFVGDENA